MATKTTPMGHRTSGFLATARITILAAAISVAGAGAASAYMGDSFLDVPGVAGGWQGAQYKNWVRVDANYWKTNDVTMFKGRNFRRQKMFFSTSGAPHQGASLLTISIDKHSPALAALMDRCVNKTTIPELTYAESSDRARALTELGPRPADIPEYIEYKLKDVQLSDCPVVAEAPDQAFVVSFNDIAWVNYHGDAEGEAFTLEPSPVKPAAFSDKTKTFVVTWIAVAHDVSDDQCPNLNDMPSQDAYYALMSKEDADKERAENEKTGGVNYQNGQMDHRGPDKLNACMLPGIVPDPGHFAPQTTVARGLNLDHNDGRGAASAGTCGHKNYVAADGRTGIDNQLYTVMGCMPGYQGHKGFLMQYSNEQRHNGLISVLVQISGIDNEKNDNSVDVTVLYSKDHMAKDASGKQILSDYSFRLTDNPEYAHYATRLHGRIVNGVIITDPVKKLSMNLGIDRELNFIDAGMRLEIMPDGTMKGVIGGYQDWHQLMATNTNSVAENQFRFQCPSMYNAFKRYADGMKDPVTGECNGISSAYDIEGVPAFITPSQPKVATKPNGHGQVAEADLHAPRAP